MIKDYFKGKTVVGFSGSRHLPEGDSLDALLHCFAYVPAAARVVVGCASGADAAVRSEFARAEVFYASSFGVGRASFAQRSAAVVAAVAAAGSAGLWVSFPSGRCPSGLVPCRSWRSSSGSGSWGSLALAAGSRVPCLVFSPAGVPGGWGFHHTGTGWFFLQPSVAAVQLSLF